MAVQSWCAVTSLALKCMLSYGAFKNTVLMFVIASR